MPNVANVSGVVQRLTEKSGRVVEIAPGSAENIDIDRDNKFLRAKVKAGLLKVGGNRATARKVARQETPIAPADAVQTDTSE